MSNYTKTTDFASKDTLNPGDPNKIVRGTEFDTEFNNIATASATKADKDNPSFEGNVSVNGNITVPVNATIDGRDVSVDGTKLDGIEAGADVTDTANVTAAGAVMDSELTNITAVKTLNQVVNTTSDVNFNTVNSRNVAADGAKLDTVEASADVTDTANVTAAGALMDSELTNIAAVKGLNQGVATTNSPTFAGATLGAVTYAATDGTDGQVLMTNGSGVAAFEDMPSSTYLDVTDFGATGDGTTDDTTSIQNAINHASNNEIQTIFFPAGHYKYTTLRLYHDATDNPNFQGESASYTGDNSTTTFAYSWPIQKASDLRVKVDDAIQTLDTDYTVSGVGNNSGGNITFISGAPALNASVSIAEANRDGRFVFLGTGKLGLSDLNFLKTEPSRIYGSRLESTAGGSGLIVEPTGTFSGTDARNFRAENMTFIADNTGYIITSESCPGMSFSNCSFKQFNTGGSGLKIRNSWFFTMDQCFVYGPSNTEGAANDPLNNTGDGITGASGRFGGEWNITDSLIDSFSNGVRWTAGEFVNVSLRNTAVQNCNNYGLYAEGGILQQLLFDNVYQENIGVRGRSFIKGTGTSTPGDEKARIRNLRMTSSFMYGPSMTGPLVDLDNVDSINCEHLYVFRPRQTFLNVTDTKNNQISSGKLENCTFTTTEDVAGYYVNYTVTTNQAVFAYKFKIEDKKGIVVLKNGVELVEGTTQQGGDYTISGIGVSSGGNITLNSDATSGDILKIYSPLTSTTASGSPTVFTGPYAQVASDLVVYVDDGSGANYTLTTDYTVSDLDNVDGATSTVTFNTAPVSGRSIKIIRPFNLLTGILPSVNNVIYPTVDKGFYFTADPDSSASRRQFIRLYDETTGLLPSYVDVKATTGIAKFGFGDTKVITVPEGSDTFTPSAGEDEFTYTFNSPDSADRIIVKRKLSGGSFIQTFDFTVNLSTKLVTLGTVTVSSEEVQISTGNPYNITGTNGRTYYDLVHTIAGGLAVFLPDTGEVNDGRLIIVKNNEATTSGYPYIIVYNNSAQSTAIAQLSPGQAGLFIMDKQDGNKFKYTGRTFTNDLEMADNHKISFGRGDSTGADLEIYHHSQSETFEDNAAGVTNFIYTFDSPAVADHIKVERKPEGSSYSSVINFTVNLSTKTVVLGVATTLNEDIRISTSESRIDSLDGVVIDGLVYPTADGNSGQVLATNGSGTLSFTNASQGGLAHVVDDTTPQLGGNLDLNSRNITGTGNLDFTGTINTVLSVDGTTEDVFITGAQPALEFVESDNSGSRMRMAWETSGSFKPTLYQSLYGEDTTTYGGINIQTKTSDGLSSHVVYSYDPINDRNFWGTRGSPQDVAMQLESDGTFNVRGGDVSFEDSSQVEKFYWDASESRLGLGTTSPAAALDVTNGHIKLSAGYSLQWDDTHERIEQSNGNLEFFTNNSQQMTISGGNVGIGTSLPDRQLSVNDFSGNGTVSINASTTGASTLYFADGNTGTNVYTGFIQYNHSIDAMQFAVNGGTERMRIDSSGRVGIGTSSPNLQFFNNLVVGNDASGDKGITIRSNAANRGVLAFSDTDSATDGRYTGFISYDHSDNAMKFHTNGGNERMRITSAGGVEIKSNSGSISHKFDYNENGGEIQLIDDAGAVATLIDQAGNNTRILELINGSNMQLGLGASNTTGDIIFMTAGNVPSARFDSSGNFGIGASSLSNGKLTLEGVDGGSSAGIYFNNTSTNGKSYSLSSGNSGEFMLYDRTSNAYRLFVNSSGDLLVGTTTGSGTTGTYSGFGAYAGGNIFSSSTGRSIFARRSSDGSIIDLRRDGTTVGSIGCNNNDPYIARAGGSGFRWYSGAVVPTNDSGATADNAMDLGSSTGRFKDLHLSGTARASTYRLQSGSTTTGGLFHEKDITGSGSSVDTTVYAETGNAIHFMVNGSATPVGTFDTSGNFGIGTSNPANNGLHIEKSGTARLRLAQAGVRSWDMEATGGAWRLNNATNSSEAFRVDSSGNLLMGTTASRTGNNSISLEASNSLMYFRATGTGSIQQAIFVRDTTGTPVSVGSIATTGTATAYNVSSDVRLKENIQDADDAGSKVDAIQVRKFDWKVNGSHQDYGMIAQELQSVAPEAVTEGDTEEDMMGVDYSKLVPMLVKEIQSLRARVAQLEND